MEKLQSFLRDLAYIVDRLSDSELQGCVDTLPTEVKASLRRIPNLSDSGRTISSRRTQRLRDHLALHNIRLSDSLQQHVREWLRDVHTFFFSTESVITPPYSTGRVNDLTSIYWRKVNREICNEIETIRNRFECLSLYHVAVDSGYHTGRSWKTNGLNRFAAFTGSAPGHDHLVEEKEKNLANWVTSGMVYRQWIKSLSKDDSEERCGYLIILPQGDISETSYVSRELRKAQREEVVDHLLRSGIEEVAKEISVFRLGQQIHLIQMSGLQKSILSRSATDAVFSKGVMVEDSFNRITSLTFERPYDSPVFLSIQYGDLNTTKNLLTNGHASVRDVDPYQLGLLYYAGYYCWKNYGPLQAIGACQQLIMFGADVTQRDDIGNNAIETLLDCALVHSAMTQGSLPEFGRLCGQIGLLCGVSLSRLGTNYLNTRGFTPLHQVLLGIDPSYSLEGFLQICTENGTLQTLIDCPDSHHRTPLRWAVEFGWVAATQILLDYGADPRQTIMCERGHTTLLHLAVAGSPYQLPKDGFRAVLKALLQAGVDVNARDHEGWTPLHTAISWGHYDLYEILDCPKIKWDLMTDGGQSINYLSPMGPLCMHQSSLSTRANKEKPPST